MTAIDEVRHLRAVPASRAWRRTGWGYECAGPRPCELCGALVGSFILVRRPAMAPEVPSLRACPGCAFALDP